MKGMALLYTLFLTFLDLFLLWRYDVSSSAMLMALLGVALISALGLLFPINSLMVKVLGAAGVFTIGALMTPLALPLIIVYCSLVIHCASLWCELERFSGISSWKAHFKFMHQMRHHWLGGLSLYVGLALAYVLVRDFSAKGELVTIFALTGLVMATVVYLEVNRVHNQNAFWVEVSGPLSSSVYYWRTVLVSGVVLFSLCWYFSMPGIERILEVREMIGDEGPGNDNDPFFDGAGAKSGFAPGEIKLSSKVDITLTKTPQLYVRMEDASDNRLFSRRPLYIHAQELVTYDNSVWSPLPAEIAWYRDADDRKVDGKIQLRRRRLGSVRHTVFLLKPGSNYLFSLTGLHTVELPKIFRSSSGMWGVGGESFKLRKYTVESSYHNYNDIQARDLALGTLRNSAYSQLPESKFIEKIKTLTNLVVRQNDSAVVKINKIRSYLKSECSYSLKVANQGNRLPLDNFLFYEKKGHCVLFASTFTLMLRAAGIPCRMVNGFAGGEYDSTKNLYVLRGENAHAWTEIFFEKYGWVVCDPTPEAGNIQAGMTSINDFSEEQFSDGLKADATKVVVDNKKSSFFGNRRNVMLLLVCAVVLLSFMWQYIKKIPALNFFGLEKKERRYSRPQFIVAFEKYCQYNEISCRRSVTVRELLSQLMQKEQVDKEIFEMVGYYYEMSFNGAPRDERKEKVWQTFLERKNRKFS